MLQFLETGTGVYGIAVICMLGILSKCMVNQVYRRMIRQTDNMATTRNAFLKNFRQRTENTYWVNQGIYNARVYVERQIYGCRFLGLPLDIWDGIAGQAVLLTLLAGGTGAYLSYWYQLDSSYMVMYSMTAAIGAIGVLLTDWSVRTGKKRDQLVFCLQDYVENSMGRRSANRTDKEEKEIEDANKDRVIVNMERGGFRSRMEQEKENQERLNESKKEEMRASLVIGAEENPDKKGFQTRRDAVKKRKGHLETERMENETVSAKNSIRGSLAEIENLRKSVEQTAAGKDHGAEEMAAKEQSGVDLTEILQPDQIRVLGEIFKEYLK